jgi:hypothetical protein
MNSSASAWGTKKTWKDFAKILMNVGPPVRGDLVKAAEKRPEYSCRAMRGRADRRAGEQNGAKVQAVVIDIN